jgi:hypothetical protein
VAASAVAASRIYLVDGLGHGLEGIEADGDATADEPRPRLEPAVAQGEGAVPGDPSSLLVPEQSVEVDVGRQRPDAVRDA